MLQLEVSGLCLVSIFLLYTYILLLTLDILEVSGLTSSPYTPFSTPYTLAEADEQLHAMHAGHPLLELVQVQGEEAHTLPLGEKYGYVC